MNCYTTVPAPYPHDHPMVWVAAMLASLALGLMGWCALPNNGLHHAYDREA
jgi:hypothetical protein